MHRSRIHTERVKTVAKEEATNRSSRRVALDAKKHEEGEKPRQEKQIDKGIRRTG